MRKIQKILLGSFLTGVLICGVGAGTAIGEYSSLTYLGERTPVTISSLKISSAFPGRNISSGSMVSGR